MLKQLRRLTMRTYAYLAHRSGLLSGLTPLSFNPVANWCASGFGHKVSARLLSGESMYVDINDYHGRVLFIFGTNDPKVAGVVKALIRPGDVFLDIGANYSTIGLAARRALGGSGFVHLFEPQSNISDSVSDTLEQSAYSNVLLHRVALLDEEGRFTMKVPVTHSGMGTLRDFAVGASWRSVEVEVKSVSAYLPKLVNGRAFGCKIDIEGSEPKVLPWLLEQENLQFLIFEAAHNHEDLYDLTSQAGFLVYGLRRTLFVGKTRRVDSINELRQFHDLVALRARSGPKELRWRELARLSRT